jgi:hypothetical protein
MPKEKLPTLSRIYQGRVSGLKLLEPKAIDGDALSKDRRDAILMGHHAEFQRAVNYACWKRVSDMMLGWRPG